MKIAFMGSTGFIGRNIGPLLKQGRIVCAPGRTELDLLDSNAVKLYLEHGSYDVIVHIANPTAQNPVDKYDELFERSMRVFMSLAHCSGLYGKMVYIGSGAEYGKHRAIVRASESEFGKELPRDAYGLSRYIMGEFAAKSNNIYNLRLFGCYGIGDPPFKLVPYIMGCIRENKPIELKQNTVFDFLYVNDIAPVITHFIENVPKHKVYNLCSGEPVLIGDIAAEIKRQMNSDVPIIFRKDGYGLEYTGNNERLCSEIQNWCPRSISEGIKEIIEHENRKG